MQYRGGSYSRTDTDGYYYVSSVGNRAGYGDCQFYIGDKINSTNCCGVKPGSYDCCSFSNYVPEEYR